jgi:hypothetical protein
MKRSWLFALLALAGCDPVNEPDPDIVLYATTGAPPAHTAQIVNEKPAYTLTLSKGAVLAAACWDSCDYRCVAPLLEVADPSVLSARPIFRATGNTTEIVLVGTSVGSTELTVRTQCAERRYAVVVVD